MSKAQPGWVWASQVNWVLHLQQWWQSMSCFVLWSVWMVNMACDSVLESSKCLIKERDIRLLMFHGREWSTVEWQRKRDPNSSSATFRHCDWASCSDPPFHSCKMAQIQPYLGKLWQPNLIRHLQARSSGSVWPIINDESILLLLLITWWLHIGDERSGVQSMDLNLSG